MSEWYEYIDRDTGEQQRIDDEHQQFLEEAQKITANTFKTLCEEDKDGS